MSYSYNEELQVLKIIEENGYYPYGLKHENYNTVLNRYKAVLNETKVALKEAPGGGQVALNDNINDYKFNGQEWQEELGLDVTAMDFRQYSNDIGRFVCIDPVTHFSQTPYQFGNGNPMYWADPSGLDGISPEPINTWHYADGNQMNTGAGNLSNGDHMFGASGDAFWGGQGAFTGGDLAWNNYNAANGSQTLYGADAVAFLRGFNSIWHEGSVTTYNATSDDPSLNGKTLLEVKLGYWEKASTNKAFDIVGGGIGGFTDALGMQAGKASLNYTAIYGNKLESALDVTARNRLYYSNIAKGVGRLATGVSVVTTAYSGYNVYNQVKIGGIQNVNGLDAADTAAGLIGLGTTAAVYLGLISNPVGWAVGTGILIYGGIRLVQELNKP